jgi:ribosomal protein L7/L12
MSIPEYILTFLLVANVIVACLSNARRLRDMERKLDLLLARLHIDPTSQVNPSNRVISLAADPQQRIAAIKAYRGETGADLREAAAVIDTIAAASKARRAQEDKGIK